MFLRSGRNTHAIPPFFFLNDFGRLSHTLDSLMGAHSGHTVRSNNCSLSGIEVDEKEEGFYIRVPLPGLVKEDIKLSTVDSVLSVEAQKQVIAPTGFKAIRRERRSINYEQKFTLPDTVNTERVDAAFKDGILTISLPKQEAVRPRSIEIR